MDSKRHFEQFDSKLMQQLAWRMWYYNKNDCIGNFDWVVNILEEYFRECIVDF